MKVLSPKFGCILYAVSERTPQGSGLSGLPMTSRIQVSSERVPYPPPAKVKRSRGSLASTLPCGGGYGYKLASESRDNNLFPVYRLRSSTQVTFSGGPCHGEIEELQCPLAGYFFF